MWAFLAFQKNRSFPPTARVRAHSFSPGNTSDGPGFDLLVSLGDQVLNYGAAAPLQIWRDTPT